MTRRSPAVQNCFRSCVLLLLVAAGAPALGPLEANAAECAHYEDRFRPVAFREAEVPVSAVEVDPAAEIAFVCGYDEVNTPSSRYWIGGLDVYDIGRPESPDLLARIEMPVRVDDMALYDGYLFLIGGNGHLVVVDVTNPRVPQVLGVHEAIPSFFDVDIEVSGGFAYVSVLSGGLQIYDVRDPGAPVRVSEWPVTVNGAWVDGSLAYICTNGAGKLGILDVSDPTQPVQIGGMGGTGGSPLDATVSGGYAYLAWGFSVRVADVSDPTNPFQVAELPLAGSAQGVVLDGNTLFVSTSFEGVVAVDVSDPTAPVELATAQTPDYTQDAEVVGAYVFAADRVGGLQVVRKADLASVRPIATYAVQTTPRNVLDVATFGDLAVVLVGSRIDVLDYSVETAPTLVGSLATTIYSADVAVEGDRAYLVGNDGLEILDLSDPAAPAALGTLALAGSGLSKDVLVDGDHAFLGFGVDGLHVVDVSDPTAPQLVATVDEWLYGEADLVDGLLYQAVRGSVGVGADLIVVDVGNPASPAIVGRTRIGHGRTVFNRVVAPQAVRVENGIACVAWQEEGLRIVDVREPTAPHLLRSVGPPGLRMDDVRLRDGIAYVSCFDSYLLYDVSRPASPVALGGATMSTAGASAVNLRHLELSPERIYAVSGFAGVITFPLQCSPSAIAPAAPTGVVPDVPATGAGVALTIDGRNPASGPSSLRLTLSARQHVAVTVHDVSGRRVGTVARGTFATGSTPLRWDGRDDSGALVAAGVYFVRAESRSGVAVTRIVRIPE